MNTTLDQWTMIDEIMIHVPDAKWRWPELNSFSVTRIQAIYTAFVAEPKTQPRQQSTTMSDEELPRQELLIKMMGMTQSDNDNQALVALRKANKLLQEAGWDWQRLIEGKIKVIADPFASVPKPRTTERDEAYGKPQAPGRPSPPKGPFDHAPSGNPPFGGFRSKPAAPQKPFFNPMPPPAQAPAADPAAWGGMGAAAAAAAKAAPHKKSYLNSNKWGNNCYICGKQVLAGAGAVFKPGHFNPSARVKPEVICNACDTDPKAVVPDKPHPARLQNQGNTLADLL